MGVPGAGELQGLILSLGDITICRNAEGKKYRLGEGGFGMVYKALMNNVDEVAVKVVKVSLAPGLSLGKSAFGSSCWELPQVYWLWPSICSDIGSSKLHYFLSVNQDLQCHHVCSCTPCVFQNAHCVQRFEVEV